MTFNDKKLIGWATLCVFLLIPAVFINLGMHGFIEDEGTRGIVAMEMIYQNDFITPTISGEYYYNKPPFYNWLIVGSFYLFGNFSAVALRFPMAISIFLFGVSVFMIMRGRLGKYFALVLALATITSGRILFYDSMHGLIDITMGWLTFMLFILIYHFYEKKKFYYLFIFAYTISACTFLMKGLPSIAFLGISLLTLFIYKKNLKGLFSIPHVTGFLYFLLIVGGYYVAYGIKNNDSLLTVFKILFIEANQKSVGGNQISDVIQHFFAFPFQYLIDFLPFTVFVIFFFKKKNRQLVWQNDFTRYLILIFVFNISIFWISPIVYARYLLMFIPVAYAVFMYPYFSLPSGNKVFMKIINGIFISAMALFTLAPLIMALVPAAKVVDEKIIKVVVLTLMLFAVFVGFLVTKKDLLFYFIASFIIVRIAFNFFVIPIRVHDSWHFITEKSSIRIGNEYKNRELCIYDYPSIFHQQDRLVLDKALYFLSWERGEVVPLCTEFEPGKLYIIAPGDYNPKIHRIIDNYYTSHPTASYVVELKE